MALYSKSNPLEEEEEHQHHQQQQQQQSVDEVHDAPAHHPSAPSDELFDISTTVDPSFIISLIRKLIPSNSHGKESNTDHMDESSDGEKVPASLNNESEEMDVVVVADDGFYKSGCHRGDGEDSRRGSESSGVLAGEEAWEEYGCVLWDLAASRTHAELMVQNFVLEVLMANLMVSRSVRVTEICLGIIGNLACHETLMKLIVSTNGLIEIIVHQLFLDDTQCLCEACRLLTLGVQGGECSTWAEALQAEHFLGRIIWVAENTLNPEVLEKSVGLLLAILESQPEVSCILLPSLMKLGLPSLLINLLAFEMSILTSERVPERYPVLDVILRAIEALSILDGHSQEIYSDNKLFQLVCDLVKLPDKIEVASSCVAAAVLIANILSDVPDLASKISQDLPFLQGVLDIFPFSSDDLEARSALWSIIARLLVRVKENEMSQSSLDHYVLALASKADLIEDDLLDKQFDKSTEESKSITCSGTKANARSTALRRIVSVLNHWTASKGCLEGNNVMGDQSANDVNIGRLLDCCCKRIDGLP